MTTTVATFLHVVPGSANQWIATVSGLRRDPASDYVVFQRQMEEADAAIYAAYPEARILNRTMGGHDEVIVWFELARHE